MEQLAKHLTEKQKAKIKGDYVVCQNYSEVARKHKIAVTTVKRIVDNDNETIIKIKQKKEQVETDILDWLAGRGEVFKDLWGPPKSEPAN